MILSRTLLISIVTLLILAIGVTLWATRDVRPEPERVLLTLGPATTLIERPLLKNGYPDYLAALDFLAQGDLTPERNAATTIFQLCGRGELTDRQAERFFGKLGVPPPAKTAARFEAWHEYLKHVPENEFPPADDREIAIRDLIQRQRAVRERTIEFREIGLAGPWRTRGLSVVGRLARRAMRRISIV
ncbi:MAG: hypothetical protein QM811_02835 [Pirellulales bacterium]